MGRKFKYYIGRRDNHQLPKPYYNAYGKISKTRANQHENTLYGSITCIPYETEQEYLDAIEKLKIEGFTVNKH